MALGDHGKHVCEWLCAARSLRVAEDMISQPVTSGPLVRVRMRPECISVPHIHTRMDSLVLLFNYSNVKLLPYTYTIPCPQDCYKGLARPLKVTPLITYSKCLKGPCGWMEPRPLLKMEGDHWQEGVDVAVLAHVPWRKAC